MAQPLVVVPKILLVLTVRVPVALEIVKMFGVNGVSALAVSVPVSVTVVVPRKDEDVPVYVNVNVSARSAVTPSSKTAVYSTCLTIECTPTAIKQFVLHLIDQPSKALSQL